MSLPDGQFFRNKNILLISPEHWGHLFVSKHHYAIELGRMGNRVFFLNPPGQHRSVQSTPYQNVTVIDYPGFLRGLRFLPGFIQRYLMKREFHKLENSISLRFDCIWSFDTSVFFDFSFLPKTFPAILHLVDYSQDFQFRKAASTALICFGVSPNIETKLKTFNSNTHLIPHGIASASAEPYAVHLPGNNAVKAVYAGNLKSELLHKSLFYQLIDLHPHVDFIFLGPGAETWEKRSNCFFPGQIQHNELSNYLHAADVLLLLYDSLRFPEQLTNAHKILEYLSAGKVIVSTFISDYESKSEKLLEMSSRSNDVTKIFADVIGNLEQYNSADRQMFRKSYASKNTYSHRLLEIEHHIANRLKEGVPV